jgi:hypothetical protein
MITTETVPASSLQPRVVAAQRLLTATLPTPWQGSGPGVVEAAPWSTNPSNG